LLRWVRVPNPFPTFIARMRPSDSPAASACLRSALGNALPAGQASVLCPVVAFPPHGRPSGRLLPTARRRGSPVLRRPDLPTGQSGVSQVTGPSSSAVPQSTTPPVPLRLAFSASGNAAFRVVEPLSIRNEGFEAAFLRPTRSPDYASTAPSRIQLQVWLPVCWLHFDWGRVGHRRGIGRRTGSRCCRPLLGTRRCLNPCLDPFPVSPTIIPDGGISPVRLEAKAYPRAAFPNTRDGLSDGAHAPSAAGLLHVSSGP
jgi:hypothetical protein